MEVRIKSIKKVTHGYGYDIYDVIVNTLPIGEVAKARLYNSCDRNNWGGSVLSCVKCVGGYLLAVKVYTD